MVSFDEQGRIELFNRAAEVIFGWTAAEVMGREVGLLTSALSLSSTGRGSATRETRAGEGRRRDGATFPLDLAVAEVPLEGRRIFTAIIRDVSEQRALERARDETLASLAAKNAELERFTYTVSHDLKSPLVTIRGFLGLVERSAAAGDLVRLKADVARIDAAADKMRQLLDELLELSRIGRAAGAPCNVPLADLARDVTEALAGPIAARGARVEPSAQLPVLYGDRLRLKQLLQNLVENALKFSRPDAAPVVRIGGERREADTLVWVQDNGQGIDPRYAEKVFGLFEKLDKKTPGTGVGLALVKRIAEVHGGRAWVESSGPGQGARFCVTLANAPRGGR